MRYEEFFFLHILNCFNAERSVSAVYHLIKGKRTSQTIQDGFLFQVHPYFQSLPHMARHELNEIITHLEKGNFIIKQDMEHFKPTDNGLKSLIENQELYKIPSGLNGWFYGAMAETFWKRLTLLVQSLSHLKAGVSAFLPVTRDESTLRWVKHFLLTQGIDRKELLECVVSELQGTWSLLPMVEADFLAHRLSGFQCDGLSVPQLCAATEKSPYEVIMLLLSGIHRTTKIINEKKDNPLLKQLLDTDKGIGITESAQKTLELLASGLSLENIARQRRLKVTTVQDHVVEIAFNDPTFSIKPFVNDDIYRVVVSAINATNSRKLSTIKQECPDDVQYFHIRLVLARERSK